MDIFSYITLCVGVIIGIIIKGIWNNHKRVTGVVQIDHETGLCRFKVIDDTLSNLKTREVLFIVDHNAKITDDMLKD